MKLEDFESQILQWYPTGSRYICNPPPLDTDNDTVILVKSLLKAQKFLLVDDWVVCDDEEYEAGEFRAYRKDDENYIVTASIGFFMRYVMATRAAKELNLLEKEDRVKLFIAILDQSSGCIGSGGFKYHDSNLGVFFP